MSADHSMFTNKNPHFFKVILGDSLRDGKLKIPIKFIRKYAPQLPSQFRLEVPSGSIWEVKLGKSDGRVWLQKGWKEFAKHYSIEHGHFLVFKYKGNAHFHVLIFDMTAAEIDYPIKQEEEEDDDDDDDVRIVGDISPCKKNRRKPVIRSPYPQPRKKMKVYSPIGTGTSMKSKIAPAPARAKHETSPKIEILKVVECLKGAKKAKALEKAESFKSRYPSFKVVMQPSSVSSAFRLVVPINFAKTYLKMLDGNSIILRLSTGKTWHPRYHHGSTPQLSGAWKAFAEENALEVGDVCAFELIKRHPEFLFKVVIFPNDERRK